MLTMGGTEGPRVGTCSKIVASDWGIYNLSHTLKLVFLRKYLSFIHLMEGFVSEMKFRVYFCIVYKMLNFSMHPKSKTLWLNHIF